MKHTKLNLSAFAIIISLVFFMGCSKDSPVQPNTDTGPESSPAITLFEDDFEGAVELEKWDVGGRQREGTNIANCVVRDSSTVGHLFKFSFTEITLAPKMQVFAFDDSLQFDFDMEVRVSSSGGALSNYYGKAGVVFNFFSEDTTSIGRVSYMAATTNYPFSSNSSTSVAVKVQQNKMTSYSITPSDLLSYLGIDEDSVSFIGLMYLCYSSTRPIPYVEAELWIDNVVVSTTSE